MDETLNDEQPLAIQDQPQDRIVEEEIGKLHAQYQVRLTAAGLRTEAIKAGMIDLDGLKLLDTSSIVLDADDRIVGGRKLMDDLRRDKPWLFRPISSSSVAAVPSSQPVRQKTALEMTDEEYAAARATLTRHQF
jgi:hypothetical protein